MAQNLRLHPDTGALAASWPSGASDLARWLIASPGAAYAMVFALQALAFLLSAVLAWRLAAPVARAASVTGFHHAGESFAAGSTPRPQS
mgnify:CR=1 FL=1